MSRKVFDVLTSAAGLVAVVVLLVAGGLLTWGHSFVNSNVHDQLAQQQIYFPPATAFTHREAWDRDHAEHDPIRLFQYAGQQLTSGAQAQAYANDFIAAHLSEMPDHGVYSKISSAALASPKNTSLAALKQASFTGTTLRGLLLEAYAFSEMGAIMLIGAIVSFVGAGVLALLAALGLAHARRTAPEEPDRRHAGPGRLTRPGLRTHRPQARATPRRSAAGTPAHRRRGARADCQHRGPFRCPRARRG